MTREPSARARERAQATSEHGRATAADTLVFERLLPGPIDNLEGQEPRPFWSTLARVEAEYEKRFPADGRQ